MRYLRHLRARLITRLLNMRVLTFWIVTISLCLLFWASVIWVIYLIVQAV